MIKTIMMKILCLLFFFFTPWTTIHSQNDVKTEILNLLKERDKQIKSLVGPEGTSHTELQRENLKNIINDIVDYRFMAKIALQSTYDDISKEQREEFVDLFSGIIRNHSLNNLDIYRAVVTYDDVDVNGTQVRVKTTAVLSNVRTPVTYDMEKRNGVWYITDMAVDNVWTAESYRRSFQNMIRRRGFDALLDNLRRRAAEA